MLNPKSEEPRVSYQGMLVLKAFCADPNVEMSGADIARVSRLPSGTLYPILLRFEDAGWLNSHWENVDPSEVGRPRRRLYRFTANGRVRARELLSEFLLPARA